MATYLDIVNDVLIRLREPEVTSVSQNSYTKLISKFVNDAKEEVENAWDWSHLRTTITVNTVPGTFGYVLSTSGTRMEVLDVINDTANWFMEYRTAREFTNWYRNIDDVKTGSPIYYSFNGVSATEDTVVEVFPKPDAEYQLRFNLVVRPTELTDNTDIVYAPPRPIIMLAYAKAVEERGEDGGVSSTSAYATAQRLLNDAIAFDAAKHPEELIYREV